MGTVIEVFKAIWFLALAVDAAVGVVMMGIMLVALVGVLIEK